ncbi:hypothetical protein DRH27_02110 [Candidatus Falkowbacteria bacterium]|nr:MAG: hypothetical protein DRH27_02110 [Candidatus Falkowbacteria bacterium]
MKIVIRAGGIGTRLWPMSRADNPKQFQNIIGSKSMLRNTYERIAPLLDKPGDLFISVNRKFKDRAKKEIPEIENNNIIIETDTRNTGPAMCLEVCYLEKLCGPGEVIASLPADDYISDNEAFGSLLLTTENFILNNPDYILTPAIIPAYPDTGYTYFKSGKKLHRNGEEAIYWVAGVVEKPNYEYCQELIKTGVYYSHTGMYLWQLKHIANLFKIHQKEMYKTCQAVVELISDKKDLKKAQELYGELEKITVETAITNKIDKIAMSVSNKIGWSDLGKWHIIKRILSENEEDNVIKGEVEISDSVNNLIYCAQDKKIIVVNDINNLAIIDTKDALFISSLKGSADVKKAVEKLKKEGKNNYL